MLASSKALILIVRIEWWYYSAECGDHRARVYRFLPIFTCFAFVRDLSAFSWQWAHYMFDHGTLHVRSCRKGSLVHAMKLIRLVVCSDAITAVTNAYCFGWFST